MSTTKSPSQENFPELEAEANLDEVNQIEEELEEQEVEEESFLDLLSSYNNTGYRQAATYGALAAGNTVAAIYGAVDGRPGLTAIGTLGSLGFGKCYLESMEIGENIREKEYEA